ncbi:MAG: hypothetical protein M5U08_21860 [Burkholderiales bacterium]|nr:hypothetical protein [Burkholderiales bacterium]
MINRIVDGIDGIRIGVHVCRGNWSKKDSVHLSGDYAPLVSAFAKMNVRQLVLEFATPRAGDLGVVGRTLSGREIGLGVANPRTDDIEPVQDIVAKVEKALAFYAPEAIFLNPDCGFGTFSGCSTSDPATAAAKMKRIVEAAKILRERHGGRAGRPFGQAA